MIQFLLRSWLTNTDRDHQLTKPPNDQTTSKYQPSERNIVGKLPDIELENYRDLNNRLNGAISQNMFSSKLSELLKYSLPACSRHQLFLH